MALLRLIQEARYNRSIMSSARLLKIAYNTVLILYTLPAYISNLGYNEVQNAHEADAYSLSYYKLRIAKNI